MPVPKLSFSFFFLLICFWLKKSWNELEVIPPSDCWRRLLTYISIFQRSLMSPLVKKTQELHFVLFYFNPICMSDNKAWWCHWSDRKYYETCRDGFAQVHLPTSERPGGGHFTIVFSAYSSDGLLYFRGNPNNGDFVSVELRDGHVIFKVLCSIHIQRIPCLRSKRVSKITVMKLLLMWK